MGPLRAPVPSLNPGEISRISGERAGTGGGLDFGTFVKLPKQFPLVSQSVTFPLSASQSLWMLVETTHCGPHPRPRDQDRCRQSSGDSSAQHPVRTTAPVCISNARPWKFAQPPSIVHPHPTQACRQGHTLPPWLLLVNAQALSTSPDLIDD